MGHPVVIVVNDLYAYEGFVSMLVESFFYLSFEGADAFFIQGFYHVL